MRRPVATAIAVLLATASAGLVPAAAEAQSPSRTGTAAPSSISVDNQEGTYQSVAPARIYDTRRNLRRPLNPGESLRLRVTDKAGVPAAGDVEAVVVNLTTTGPTRNGYLAAYPSSSSGAGVSTLTYAAGDTRAVLATVPVGPDGSIVIRNGAGTGAGTAHAIVDVQGYYRAADAPRVSQPSQFRPSEPFRAFDSRQDGGPLAAYYSYELYTAFDEDNEDVDALVVNLTAVGPQAPGYLTAYDDYTAEPPPTSSLNFTRGRTTTNQVVVPVQHHNDGDGYGDYLSFAVFVGTQRSVHVIADVVGSYDRNQRYGQRFVPLDAPVRVADSRTGAGGLRTLGAHQSGRADVSSAVDDASSTAVVGSLTAVRPTASTFLTAWMAGSARPGVSNLNPAAGQTVSNQAIIELGEGNIVSIYNQAGSTDVLLDAVGHFDIPPDAFGQSAAGRAAGSSQPAEHPGPTTEGRAPGRTTRAAHR